MKCIEQLRSRIHLVINGVFKKSRKKPVPDYFEQLKAELPTMMRLSQSGGANGFFAQEALRFYSIAGTLLSVEEFALDKTSSVDERYLTHVLSRSLLENYFTIIYLFDDPSQTAARYDELKNTFKEDYRKLMNDLNAPSWQNFMQTHKAQLEPVDPTWTQAKGLPNVNDMLVKLRNDYSDRLSYLYPVYRISSFDTHGRSLGTIFEAVFGKKCNFPVLNIKYAFELIANQYLVVLNDLRKSGAI